MVIKIKKEIKKHEEINLHIKHSTFYALLIGGIIAIITWSDMYLKFKYYPKQMPTGFEAAIAGIAASISFFLPIVVFISIKYMLDEK